MGEQDSDFTVSPILKSILNKYTTKSIEATPEPPPAASSYHVPKRLPAPQDHVPNAFRRAATGYKISCTQLKWPLSCTQRRSTRCYWVRDIMYPISKNVRPDFQADKRWRSGYFRVLKAVSAHNEKHPGKPTSSKELSSLLDLSPQSVRNGLNVLTSMGLLANGGGSRSKTNPKIQRTVTILGTEFMMGKNFQKMLANAEKDAKKRQEQKELKRQLSCTQRLSTRRSGYMISCTQPPPNEPNDLTRSLSGSGEDPDKILRNKISMAFDWSVFQSRGFSDIDQKWVFHSMRLHREKNDEPISIEKVLALSIEWLTDWDDKEKRKLFTHAEAYLRGAIIQGFYRTPKGPRQK